MMSEKRSIEVAGDSVEEAISKGLAELGVGPGDVIVEVLEEASKGMLGFGSRQALVRLQLLTAPDTSVSTPDHAQVFNTVSHDDITDAVDIDDSDLEIDDELSLLQQPEITDETLAADDAIVGRAVLHDLLDKMAVDAEVKIRRSEMASADDESPWLLDVSGSNLSRLIGRRGETLSALQYITRLIASRELQRRANIIVDVDGYKSRRAGKLHNLALRMAEQVAERGQSVTLEPMPPYERRIIHLALRDYEGVDTRSVGEGDARKVTIRPT